MNHHHQRYETGMLRLLFLFTLPLQAQPLGGPAKPDFHPYCDPKGGRENYELANHTVNEARLYDFYQRQADYYMANPDQLTETIPSYPGLDAALHGHWGKHNQNNHNDTRWNNIEHGEHLTHVTRHGKLVVLKGINLRLGENRELSACFDPQSLTYRAVWQGGPNGFVTFHGFRWGCSRNAHIQGQPWFTTEKVSPPKNATYLGFHRYGERIVFKYKIGDVTITDEPWATKDSFYRRLDISPTGHLDFPLGNQLYTKITYSKNVEAVVTNGILSLKSAT